MSLSLKQRTTSQIASVSRIFAKNLFPSPSPRLAPLTRPAISVNSISKLLTKINVTIIKFFVDVIIFIINYIIQRNYIFKHNNE